MFLLSCEYQPPPPLLLRAAMPKLVMTYKKDRHKAARAREIKRLRTNPKHGPRLPPNRFFEVLGVGNGILLWSFMTMRGACVARLVCKYLRDSASAWPWDDLEPESRVFDVALWRQSFPRARACHMADSKDEPEDDEPVLTDALLHIHFGHGRVDRLLLGHQPFVSDDGLACLGGVRLLQISGNPRITDAGLAHLRAVEALSIGGCPMIGGGSHITDAGIAQLPNVRFFDTTGCRWVTDKGLEALGSMQRGVRVLDLEGWVQQSLRGDDGRASRLKGVTRLVLYGPPLYEWSGLSFASLAQHLAALDKHQRTWGSNEEPPARMEFQPAQPEQDTRYIKQWLAWDTM